MHIPRLLVSALRGGAGKTLISLGLARAFSAQGLRVKPFKKGPDYIDAAWLAHAAHFPCTNLDPFFLSPDRLRALFQHAWTQFCEAQEFKGQNHAAQSHEARACAAQVPAAPCQTTRIALLEGNRGLFDGRDVQGSCSSAELARVLDTPVLLSLDCTKMTRTAAAIVAGLANFEPGVRLAGVVLNQIASARHESIVRQSIEAYTDIPVLGALPRLKHNPLPERHMGLVMDGGPIRAGETASTAITGSTGTSSQTHDAAHAVLEQLGAFITEHTDLTRILELARSTPPMAQAAPFWPALATTQCASTSILSNSPAPAPPISTSAAPITSARPRIGFVRDAALWFYYHENFEALDRAGAELVPLSLLDHQPWPALDGLYLGGGFPEEYAEQLSATPHLASLRALSIGDAPIYAECGGFMLLAESIVRDGFFYPMAGIFPVSAHFQPRPQGLGYVEATVSVANPFHPLGAQVRGHEFHYSRASTTVDLSAFATLHLTTGTGMGAGMGAGMGTGMGMNKSTRTTGNPPHVDGLCLRNTFAAYTHIFAPAVPWWAENFVAAARTNRMMKKS